MAIYIYFLSLILFFNVFAQEDLFELNIIHYNDFHAHFPEVSPAGTACAAPEEGCIGGIARLYTAIRELQELEPDSLLLNGGDSFQGTVWYNLFRWNGTATFMNALPKHDAHVLGNHEFDNGIEGLIPYLRNLDSVMLGANVNADLEPEIQELYQNHVVVERRGRRIGIIGILLTTFSAPIGQIVMEDEVQAVNREAAILTEQGIDIVVVLSHCGLDTDRWIATRVTSDVDVIVGAHSHSLLYNGDTPNGDTALGTYPVVVTQENGHQIPIVQASAYTRYLGNIKLYIDSAGQVQTWEGQPIFLGNSIVPDPRMVELLEPWKEEVDAFGKEVLGRSLVTLNRSWCRRGECNMGSWACDGFLQQMMQLAEGSAWNHAHVCFINSGGLRTQILPGDVTTEILMMALPFENDLQVYSLAGRYLLQLMEFSVSGNVNPEDFDSGRLLQVGGLRVVFNVSAPDGARVSSLNIRCIDCEVPQYQPVQLDTMYRVVSQSYIGDGGGGYTMIPENREDFNVLDEPDYVYLQKYMRQVGTVLQDLDGRIQIIT